MVGADDTYSGNDDAEPGKWPDGLGMTLSSIGTSDWPDGWVSSVAGNLLSSG